jgi:hypothetical protein
LRFNRFCVIFGGSRQKVFIVAELEKCLHLFYGKPSSILRIWQGKAVHAESADGKIKSKWPYTLANSIGFK